MTAQTADRLDWIEVRGARENNLKNISVDIPKRRLMVFTGVSGFGKSSLVFDTIAAESQRPINETYTAFIQSFLPNQGRMGSNSRSTVGTATDAHAMLRGNDISEKLAMTAAELCSKGRQRNSHRATPAELRL